MKPRWLIATGLLTLVIASAALWFFWPERTQAALEETRRALRQQGFKIDLSEFDFTSSADALARGAALTNVDLTAMALGGTNDVRRAPLAQRRPDLMAVAGSNAAVVIWKQEKPALYRGPFNWLAREETADDLWPRLRETLDEHRLELDDACKAALAGPIRFPLIANPGGNMMLSHLMKLRSLAHVLGTRAALELHDGHKDAAWTNVFALTRMVTAWDPEPSETSYPVRSGCATVAYNAAWQAVQAGGWTDDRLARLQAEWESVDCFKGVPDTAAFTRASTTATCQLERREPLPPSAILNQLRRSPWNIWSPFLERWRRIRYRQQGSFEDERALLLHYRDQELALRRAIEAPTWLEMRQLPGVTNPASFQSRYSSRVSTLIGLRQNSMGFMRQGQGLLGRVAETEARRRLLITAIALERYRGQHGAYPQTLQDLVPTLLRQPPVDFMDGQPLRYHLTGDGHFVLYSVGLDCVDNGGEMRRPRRPGQPFPGPPEFTNPEGTDLVWPRPASEAEVQSQQQETRRQIDQTRAAIEERRTDEQRQAEAERQAVVEKLLTAATAMTAGPQGSRPAPRQSTYQEWLLSELLRNPRTAGTNNLTLYDMLTAQQVYTGEEPQTATFEVPVSYDAATNFGRIHLVVDGDLDATSGADEGQRQTCKRATNGNCLLGWTTTYDPPGKHAIQAEFILTREGEKEDSALKVRGPATPIVSTNLCQFGVVYDPFDTRGPNLLAWLPESNGVYVIELTSPEGRHLKTLSGTTSNGVIKLQWDLIDEHGTRYTNNHFDSVFEVTLPDSGRRQRLKGP